MQLRQNMMMVTFVNESEFNLNLGRLELLCLPVNFVSQLIYTPHDMNSRQWYHFKIIKFVKKGELVSFGFGDD